MSVILFCLGIPLYRQLTYCLIQKPLNVDEPRMVTDLDEELRDDLCLMIMKKKWVVI